jgi:hypothetical protein
MVTSLGFMKQNPPAHVKAMTLRKALSEAQKRLDISEKLIDDLRQNQSIKAKD